MKSVSVTLTGAFSYTGRYIGQELLRRKIPFQSLTNHPRPSVYPSASIPVVPLQFQDASLLISALQNGFLRDRIITEEEIMDLLKKMI